MNIFKAVKRKFYLFLEEQYDFDQIDALSGEKLRIASQAMDTVETRIAALHKAAAFHRPVPLYCSEFKVVPAETDGSTILGGRWSVVCGGYHMTHRFESKADADEMMRCLIDRNAAMAGLYGVMQKIHEIRRRIDDRRRKL